MIKHSLVIPIYKNSDNIDSLLLALVSIQNELSGRIEFIFVIDGSPDDSKQQLLDKSNQFLKQSRIISLSKNFGSFTAIRAGMSKAKGEFIAVMAADLQEPPDLVLNMFKSLEYNQLDVIFGQRMSRKDPIIKKLLSSFYWRFYKKFIIQDIPSGGVDIFACNRKVLDSILDIEERNSSLIAQLFWVGYKRGFIPYHRKEREHGSSAWDIRKRIRYMLDSIFSYTDLPILFVLCLGLLGLFSSLTYVLIVSISYSIGYISQPGFASQSILITIFGSSILFSQGILGCYIWRVLENSKKRPLYFIESDIINNEKD